MSKLTFAVVMACLAVVSGVQAGAESLSAPTNYGSLDNVRVIVDGVDVTDFAQLRDGQIEVRPTSDIAARPTITLIDEETGQRDVLRRVRQRSFDIAIAAVSDFSRGERPRYSLDISPSAQFGRNGWTFSAGAKLIGIDRDAKDRYNFRDLVLHTSKALASGATFEMGLGQVGAEIGNDIISSSLTGRGVSLSLAHDRFDAAAIFIGRNSPTNYLGEDHRFGADAYRRGFRLGYAHQGESWNMALAAQALQWSDEDLAQGARGSAVGLTLEAEHMNSGTNAQLVWAQSRTPSTGKASAFTARLGRSFQLGEVPLSLELSYGYADKDINFPETYWSGDQENVALNAGLALPWGSIEAGFEFGRDNVERDPMQIANLNRVSRLSVSIDQLPEVLGFLSAVGLSAERQFTGAANASAYLAATGDDPDYIPKAYFDLVTLSFDFAAQNGTTSLSLSHGFYDEQMTIARNADTRERSIGLARSWSWGTFDFDGQIQLNMTDELDPESPSESKNVDYALGIRWAPEDLPHISLEYALNQSRQAYPLWDEKSNSRTETIGLAVDLSPWFGRLGLADSVSTTVSWRKSKSTFDAQTEKASEARLQFALSF